MNFKPRILEALQLANQTFHVHFRRRNNGTLYPVWRPKLPPGSVDLQIEYEGCFDANIVVTFHKRFRMGRHQAYPGMSLLTTVRVPCSSKREHKLISSRRRLA
jgi:hypothetical protein